MKKIIETIADVVKTIADIMNECGEMVAETKAMDSKCGF